MRADRANYTLSEWKSYCLSSHPQVLNHNFTQEIAPYKSPSKYSRSQKKGLDYGMPRAKQSFLKDLKQKYKTNIVKNIGKQVKLEQENSISHMKYVKANRVYHKSAQNFYPYFKNFGESGLSPVTPVKKFNLDPATNEAEDSMT